MIRKTVGELIDELTKTNLKIWFAIEEETSPDKTWEERGKAGSKVLKLNKQRHKLIAAINEILGENFLEDEKTY